MMKTERNLLHKGRWLWAAALLALLPSGSLAQSENYEMVITLKGGSEVALPITEGYPLLSSIPVFYDDGLKEIFRAEYEANAFYDIEASHVKQLTTRIAQPRPSITPISTDIAVDFTNKFTEGESLFNRAVDNVYVSFDPQYDNGYHADAEGLVLHTTFLDWANQIFDLQSLRVGDLSLGMRFRGFIVEVPAGNGSVTVDMETHGNYKLTIFNFANMGMAFESETRTIAVYPYRVTEPTYIYIFPASQTGLDDAQSSVVIHGIKVTTSITGVQGVKKEADRFDVYTTDGRLMRKAVTSADELPKGVYVIKHDNRRTFKTVSR